MVVSFCASWCGPCKAISPVVAELSGKYPSLMFLTVDVDGLAVSIITDLLVFHFFPIRKMCNSTLLGVIRTEKLI